MQLIITRGREVTSLGFAFVSFWGRDLVIINFFPSNLRRPIKLALTLFRQGRGGGGGGV